MHKLCLQRLLYYYVLNSFGSIASPLGEPAASCGHDKSSQ